MAERVMGADHIAAAGGSYEPQRPFNFQVIFPAEFDDLRLAVHSLPVPIMRVGKITIPWLNEERHAPGAITFEPRPLVLTDYVRPSIAQRVMEFFGLVYNFDTGGISYAAACKKDLAVQSFGPDNSDKRTWLLKGCFAVSVDIGEFSMETREAPVRITMELSVDRVAPESLGTS